MKPPDIPWLDPDMNLYMPGGRTQVQISWDSFMSSPYLRWVHTTQYKLLLLAPLFLSLMPKNKLFVGQRAYTNQGW